MSPQIFAPESTTTPARPYCSPFTIPQGSWDLTRTPLRRTDCFSRSVHSQRYFRGYPDSECRFQASMHRRFIWDRPWRLQRQCHRHGSPHPLLRLYHSPDICYRGSHCCQLLFGYTDFHHTTDILRWGTRRRGRFPDAKRLERQFLHHWGRTPTFTSEDRCGHCCCIHDHCDSRHFQCGQTAV
jgi:hypothetical protein